ncbi:MAG: HAD family phosphatase [Erysipelotrichaceae bacterium]|nr:HAD family phosphatase [Erysipelotrichaceae bacterium]
MIKLVASDLDNTLLYKGKIRQEDVDIIHQMQKQGIEFAIASGRDIASIRPVLKPFDIQCSAIVGNGAEYRDEHDEVLMSCYMDKSVFKDVLSIFHQLDIPYMVYMTDGFYTCYEPEYVRIMFARRCHARFDASLADFEPGGSRSDMPCCHLQKIEDMDAFLAENHEIIKVEAFHEDETKCLPSHELLEKIPGISYLSSFSDNVEVTNVRAQKGFILEEVIKKKGITKEEVIVLGDGMNDLSLFECFPYSFAPCNSDEGILKHAYHVVSRCQDGGFAEAIHYALDHL